MQDAQRAQVQQQGAGAMALRFLSAMAEPTAAPGPKETAEERRSLWLRDGDVIPSVITKIDENGVWFRSSLSTSTFVPNEKVKAIELAPSRPTAARRRCSLLAPRKTGC